MTRSEFCSILPFAFSLPFSALTFCTPACYTTSSNQFARRFQDPPAYSSTHISTLVHTLTWHTHTRIICGHTICWAHLRQPHSLTARHAGPRKEKGKPHPGGGNNKRWLSGTRNGDPAWPQHTKGSKAFQSARPTTEKCMPMVTYMA